MPGSHKWEQPIDLSLGLELVQLKRSRFLGHLAPIQNQHHTKPEKRGTLASLGTSWGGKLSTHSMLHRSRRDNVDVFRITTLSRRHQVFIARKADRITMAGRVAKASSWPLLFSLHAANFMLGAFC